MDFVERLTCFGLTRQESFIYTTLLSEGELTGYEVAKQTGISRSNTYTALAGLVEKGAAYIIEGNSIKYTPVCVEEFCNNKLYQLEKIQKELLSHLPLPKKESDGYITIKGKKHILDKVGNMIKGAKQRIYLSVSKEVLVEIEENLRNILQKGIKVVIITNWEHYMLLDAKIYYNDKSAIEIGLIVDTKTVLTGEVDMTALYSENKNLVTVFKEMLKNEIKLLDKGE